MLCERNDWTFKVTVQITLTLRKMKYVFENISIFICEPWAMRSCATNLCMLHFPRLWHCVSGMRRIGTVLPNEQSSRDCLHEWLIRRPWLSLFHFVSFELIDTEMRLTTNYSIIVIKRWCPFLVNTSFSAVGAQRFDFPSPTCFTQVSCHHK
jgi:hypothetical protein